MFGSGYGPGKFLREGGVIPEAQQLFDQGVKDSPQSGE